MADQSREIDLNEDIDLNKEYDMAERIISLEHINHLLLEKVDKLETNHRVELEAKEMEIRGLKRKLEDYESRWKIQMDLLCTLKNDLAERPANELLTKDSESERKLKIQDNAISQSLIKNKQVGGSSDVNKDN
ncbi:hypothetical protein P3S68_008251 [Capsicum galapagoense]